MLKVDGRYIWRAGEKIGYVCNGYVLDHDGDKIGFYSGNSIEDKSGEKIAYLEGDYIHFLKSSDKVRIEDNNHNVSGGSLSNLEKAAARVLLGE